MKRALMALTLVLGLAACGAQSVVAPTEDVARAAYVHPGPKTLTLYTAISNRTGKGAHSGLMVNASQRVMFDPAGTWHHPTAPEVNDVIFGMNDTLVDFYVDYHARETFHVVIHELEVSPEIAEQALALVRAHGPAAKATCAQSISGILRELGFETVSRDWWPHRVMDDFAALPGVTEDKFFDDSPDNNYEALRLQRAQEFAQQQLN